MSPELGKIFGELSWTSRLQLLDQYYPAPNKTVMSMESLMRPAKRPGSTSSFNIPPKPPKLEEDQGPFGPEVPQPTGPGGWHGPGRGRPWPGQRPPQGPHKSRRAGREVGVSALKMPRRPVAGRRQTPSGDYPPTNPPSSRDDDTSMKLKLFRLMYETVRDSDLKVKRAELIKTQYVNSSAFEVGYLLGDISDKYNIISDIAMTLRRLYNDWRPIEHINAYEQIANQAIEISHLIDLAKTVHKRNKDNSETNKKIKLK